MKSKHQLRIEEFMKKAGQEVPEKPALPSQEVRLLRAKLILEEALETINALGFSLINCLGMIRMDTVKFIPNGEEDLVEIADGCADLSVVTIGTLSACGVSDLPLLEEVDKNNLLKFKDGVKRDENGKLIKPKDHPKPDVKRVLSEQGADLV